MCVCTTVRIINAHTHSCTCARVEAVITETTQEAGLSYAGVPHQHNLKKAVRQQGATFFLNKERNGLW